MPVEVEPPELAHVLNLSERPRIGDWSLRSALVRYAKPEPERVRQLLEQVRRIGTALQPNIKRLEREGPEVWALVTNDPSIADSTEDAVVGLLRSAVDIDALADTLAKWAVDPSSERPNSALDKVVADVSERLDALGVATEQRDGPARRRS